MDSGLRSIAAAILSQLPCALEMPAGTGKTQLVAGVTALSADSGHRTLILTHTNAGVSALRKRLKKFGVSTNYYQIDTITGWAFELVRHYPRIAGIEVPQSPNWNDSQAYLSAAIAVAQCPAINRMHAASFRYFLVDEYQDCSVQQHAFILAIADAIDGSAVFGDRLQGIFDFGGQTLVDWVSDVFPRFPSLVQDHQAWRWRGHNEALGAWLLEVRSQFMLGGVLDLSTANVPGLQWRGADSNEVVKTAFRHLNSTGSVVVIDKWRQNNVNFATRLGGTYSVMEDLNGSFMQDMLKQLEELPSSGRALWLAQLAKRCFSGLAKIDATVIKRLGNNQPIDDLKRPELATIVSTLQTVQNYSTLRSVAAAMKVIEVCGEAKLHSHEAWRDMTAAIQSASIDGDRSLRENLASTRDRLRYTDRLGHQHLASRTLLIKGLEYDHAIVANADGIGDVKNLYVALTRPRTSLTIFSSSPQIALM